jgi:hypothetical protein
MSDFTDAFGDLLDCQAEVVGSRPTATIGTVTAEAFVEKLTYDEVIVAGGVAESGGFRLMMRVSDFPSKPSRNAVAILSSLTLYVLSIDENNGIYELKIGDPANE